MLGALHYKTSLHFLIFLTGPLHSSSRPWDIGKMVKSHISPAECGGQVPVTSNKIFRGWLMWQNATNLPLDDRTQKSDITFQLIQTIPERSYAQLCKAVMHQANESPIWFYGIWIEFTKGIQCPVFFWTTSGLSGAIAKAGHKALFSHKKRSPIPLSWSVVFFQGIWKLFHVPWIKM